MSGAILASSVISAGVGLYGANKQSKDNAAANAANVGSSKEQDLNSWKAYLMQRGLDPSGVYAYGQMPTGGKAVNTRLPLWANGNFAPKAAPAAPRTSMVRRRTG